MDFFDRIFSKKSQPADTLCYEASFGRYTDAYKTEAQNEAWDRAIEQFEKQEYRKSLLDFIDYIKNPDGSNIILHSELPVYFDILQGSKTIEVRLKNGVIFVECRIAMASEMNIGFMRRLLDLNYELKYVRYGLTDDRVIVLCFDTPLTDASPYKLYFALKELSIHADKQDDLLLQEFSFLHPVRSGKIEPALPVEAGHKLAFFRAAINKALHLVDHGKLKTEQYPTATGYILLAAMYKLDYLIRPEGSLVDKIEQIHKSYFAQDQKNIQLKLKHLRQEILKLRQMSDAELTSEIYHTISTFGITTPATLPVLHELIDRETQSIQWYIDQEYHEYALAMVEYIAGFSLFNFALPLPAKDLLHLIFRVTEAEFFKKIKGNQNLMDRGKISKAAVRAELNRLEARHQKNYLALTFDYKKLSYDSPLAFAHGILLMIRSLQLQKAR